MKPERENRFEERPARSAVEIGCIVIMGILVVFGIVTFLTTMKGYHEEKTRNLIMEKERIEEDLKNADRERDE